VALRHGEPDDSPGPWTLLRLSVRAEARRDQSFSGADVISFSVSSDAGAGCAGTSLCSMGAGDSSAGALLGSIVVGVSSTGRGRGSGSDDARRWLLPLPVRWPNQVRKSCAIPDRGGGASRRGGGGMDGACAPTGGAATNRNDRENVPALNTLDLTVIPLPLRAIDGRRRNKISRNKGGARAPPEFGLLPSGQ
jgi:hypothetical protein